MAIPNKATGYGHVNNATKVFKVTFSTALSTAPKLESWDNSQTFPAVDTAGSTTAKEIFTGTAGNSNYPMLAAWSGGLESAPNLPGANWHPASPTAGSANPNLLKGTTNYVTCSNTPGAGGDTVLNLSLRAPYDATVPSTTSMAHLIQIRYTYTGSAPTVAFLFNEGTEGSPSWTTFTSGTHGLRHCNSGTEAGGPYKLTLPSSGQVYAAEGWITV